jgi:tetratricopeptide (TPR) repeat protein
MVPVNRLPTMEWVVRAEAENGESESSDARASHDAECESRGDDSLSRRCATCGIENPDLMIDRATREIERHPDNAKAYAYRGLARRWSGDYGRALADLEQALALNPRELDSHFWRLGVYIEQRDWDALIAALSEMIELGLEVAQCYGERAYVRELQGDLEGARADEAKAIELRTEALSGGSPR